MRYPRVLPSYKSLDTFRVVRVDADHYGVVHPGHAIPHGMDWIADCATMRDATERADYAMDGDALMSAMSA